MACKGRKRHYKIREKLEYIYCKDLEKSLHHHTRILVDFWPQVTQLYPLLGGSLVPLGEGVIGELDTNQFVAFIIVL